MGNKDLKDKVKFLSTLKTSLESNDLKFNYNYVVNMLFGSMSEFRKAKIKKIFDE